MARANNGGWDFIKEGETYQYNEVGFICMVKVTKDRSDAEYYRFDLEIVPTPGYPESWPDGTKKFSCCSAKDLGGYFSGMLQFYALDSVDRYYSLAEIQAARQQ